MMRSESEVKELLEKLKNDYKQSKGAMHSNQNLNIY